MALPLTSLIIDDEPLARQELQYLLEAAGDITVLAQGSNGIEAVELIRTCKPDVVFLDVRMPGLDGFAVLKKVLAQDRKAKLPYIVFATAFDQYAVKAFEVNAVDYLLKPFDAKRVVRTIEKVRARLIADSELAVSAAVKPEPAPVLLADPGEPAKPNRMGATRPAKASPVATSGAGERTPARGRLWDAAEEKLDALLRMIQEQTENLAAQGIALGTAFVGGPPASAVPREPRTGRVVVRSANRLMLVDQRDVCFASIEEGRISVVTKTLEGDSNCRTLEELTDQLDPDQFWRVHRSFLVNIQHIREVVPWFKSSYQLRMDDRQSTEIPVSRSQTKRLRELFNL